MCTIVNSFTVVDTDLVVVNLLISSFINRSLDSHRTTALFSKYSYVNGKAILFDVRLTEEKYLSTYDLACS